MTTTPNDAALTDVLDPATGKTRMTAARRAELAAKYPSLAADEPQATDALTQTYDPRDPRARKAWALRTKFPSLQND